MRSGLEETGDGLFVMGAIVTGVTARFNPTLPSTMTRWYALVTGRPASV